VQIFQKIRRSENFQMTGSKVVPKMQKYNFCTPPENFRSADNLFGVTARNIYPLHTLKYFASISCFLILCQRALSLIPSSFAAFT